MERRTATALLFVIERGTASMFTTVIVVAPSAPRRSAGLRARRFSGFLKETRLKQRDDFCIEHYLTDPMRSHRTSTSPRSLPQRRRPPDQAHPEAEGRPWTVVSITSGSSRQIERTPCNAAEWSNIANGMGRLIVDASAVLHPAGAGAKVATRHKLLAPTLLRSQAPSGRVDF